METHSSEGTAATAMKGYQTKTDELGLITTTQICNLVQIILLMQ